jgi:hypothetical protein
MARLDFDANNVEPQVEFEPVPAGKYIVAIVESEMKDNKAGTGRYLELSFEILEGQYKGRKVWARLNLDNPSAMAVKIAKGELSAICRAVGVMTPADSYELHNLPLTISVKLKKYGEEGKFSNEISGYSKREMVGQALQSTSDTPPWAR